jgi:hypothetical protein
MSSMSHGPCVLLSRRSVSIFLFSFPCPMSKLASEGTLRIHAGGSFDHMYRICFLVSNSKGFCFVSSFPLTPFLSPFKLRRPVPRVPRAQRVPRLRKELFAQVRSTHCALFQVVLILSLSLTRTGDAQLAQRSRARALWLLALVWRESSS